MATVKRGDLAIIHTVSRVSVNGDSDYDMHSYDLHVVTSITRDGAVKAVRDLMRVSAAPRPVERMGRHSMVRVPAAVCDLAALAQRVRAVRGNDTTYHSPVELLRDLAPHVSDPSAIELVHAAAVRAVRDDIDFQRVLCARCGVQPYGNADIVEDSDGCPVAVCRTCPVGVNFSTAYPVGLEVMVTGGYAAHLTAKVEAVCDAYPGGEYGYRAYRLTLPGYGTRTVGEDSLEPVHVPADRYAVTRETSQPAETSADGGASLAAPETSQRVHVSQPVEDTERVAPVAQSASGDTATCPAPACGRTVRVTRDGRYRTHRAAGNDCGMSRKPIDAPAPAARVAETAAVPTDGASSQPVETSRETSQPDAQPVEVDTVRELASAETSQPVAPVVEAPAVEAAQPAAPAPVAAQPVAAAQAPVASSLDYPHAAILRELAGRPLAGRVKVTRRDGAWSYRAPLADGGEVAGRAVWSDESAAWVVCEVVPTAPASAVPDTAAAVLAGWDADRMPVPVSPAPAPVARVMPPARVAALPVAPAQPKTAAPVPAGERGRYAYAAGTRVKAMRREVWQAIAAAARAPETAPLFTGVSWDVQPDRPTAARPTGYLVVTVEAPAGADLAPVWAVVDSIAAQHVPAPVVAAV